MCVWDPHGVWIALTYWGFAGSEMSKIRIPSQCSSVSSTRTASQRSLDMVSSMEMNTSEPTAVTSPCPPAHATALTRVGDSGSAMSQTVNPL